MRDDMNVNIYEQYDADADAKSKASTAELEC